MKQGFTKNFITLLLFFGVIFCQQSNGSSKENSLDSLEPNDKIDYSENRLPDLLK